MTTALWQPSPEQIAAANMTRFMSYVNARHTLALDSYDALYRWSVTDIPAFWAAAWDFLEIEASVPFETPGGGPLGVPRHALVPRRPPQLRREPAAYP